jgi:RND superfamily putative drug exporter
MSRLIRIAIRWPVQVIGVWAVFIGVLFVIGLGAEKKLVPTQLFIPGTQSFTWHQLRAGHFGESAAVLLDGPPQAIDRQGPALFNALLHRPGTIVLSPWSPSPAAKRLRPKPDQALLVVELDVAPGKTIDDVVPPWINFVKARVHPPLTPHYTGITPLAFDINTALIQSLHKGENLAFPVLIIVLLLVFRSPIAAAIPLVIALASVRAGFGIVDIIAGFKTLDAIALSMTSMIGLALGVDYSLLIVSRFREVLATGMPPKQAATFAANTAGRTAIFAGCVLLTLMVPLYIIAPGTIIPSGAVGAAAVTVLCMLAATMITPAACALVGHNVNRFMFGGRGAAATAEGGLIARVVRAATDNPFRAIGLVGPILAIFALPLLFMKIIPPDPRGLPPGSPGLVDYHAVRAAGFGPEVEVVLKTTTGTLVDPNLLPQVDAFENQLRALPNVSFVVGPGALASKVAPLRTAPQQIAAAKRNLAAAKHELAYRAAELHRAKRQVAAAKIQLNNGIAQGESLLALGDRLMSGVNGGISQLGLLTTGLGAAQGGAQQLLNGAQLLSDNAKTLASSLSMLKTRIEEAFPLVSSGDQQLRDAQASLALLRVPAQVTEQQLQNAWASLNAMTIGKTDPHYLAALAQVGIALGAATGTNPLNGTQPFSQYQGFDTTLGQASAQASRAGDRIDTAVGEVGQGSNALIQLADGSGRLVNPGLSTIIYGLDQLNQGLGYAHTKLQQAQPQIQNEVDTGRSLFTQASSLFNNDVLSAAPQFQELQNGVDEGSARIDQIYSELTRKSGPFTPLREVSTLDAISPNFFKSGYLVVAALNGATFVLKGTANAIVDSTHGGDVGRIILLPNVPTNDPRQDQIVDSVRNVASRFAKQNNLVEAVGGSAAELTDYKRKTDAAIPLLIIVACVFTYILLLPILRAIILPAIAIALNLVTVAASFGILNFLFVRHGPLFDPLGGSGALDVIAVSGIFAIMYALSIDYQVFLLSRMREEFVRTQSNAKAIEFGIAKTARVVTGAAVIMIAVFSSFGLAPFVLIKMFGIGLGTAVLIDATLVRLMILPAVMRVFGERTWWMPQWLDDRLPSIDTEGAGFEHEMEMEMGQHGGEAAAAH